MNSQQIVQVDPQYPSEIIFKGLPDAAQLATDYGVLVKIDADSATQIKLLAKAVKDVTKARLAVDKEKKRLLDPANKYRNLINEEYKSAVEPFKMLEDNLKAEKKRVDDIQEQRLEEQRKLHQSNLEIIRARGRLAFGASMESLSAELEIIDKCNLSDFDFGDLEEDAKVELANARMRTEQAIEQENQRVKLAEQQAELDRQAEQRRLDDAKRDYEQAHESAIQENELFDTRAKLSAAEAVKQTPKSDAITGEDAAYLNEVASGTAEMTDESFADAMGMPNSSNSFCDPGPDPAQKVICDDDLIKINTFIGRLKAQIDLAPVDFVDAGFASAVNRVVANLNKTAGYLNSVAKGGDA